MVKAILEGRKSQTRRIIKLPDCDGEWSIRTSTFDENDDIVFGDGESHQEDFHRHSVRPYAIPGQRLWVKETFSPWADDFTKWICQSKDKAVYRADYKAGCSSLELGGCEHWKPSIFMPRKASRITLEITGVRVERLKDISVADCIAEGIESVGKLVPDRGGFQHGEIVDYSILWECINGKGSWDANPWVWVISFKRINP